MWTKISTQAKGSTLLWDPMETSSKIAKDFFQDEDRIYILDQNLKQASFDITWN